MLMKSDKMSNILRPSFILLLICVGIFLSAYPSDANEFRSHHLSKQRNHFNHKKIKQQRNEKTSAQNREKRDASVPLSELIEEEIEKEEKEEKEIDGQVEVFPGMVKKQRKKRSTFAWPPNTLFITEFSMEMPLYAPDGVAIPFLIEVPYEFDLPNITYDGGNTVGRSIDERATFFGTVESLFSRFGFEGRTCMLRAVCERAESDVLTEGLLGEVLNLILAVSSTGAGADSLTDYMDAEYHGKSLGDCEKKYSSCPISIFHFFDTE